MTFFEKLDYIARKNHSLLCVGLDSDPEMLPAGVNVFDFNRAIIEATRDLVCAYKVNLAFYEALDSQGMEVLKQTVKFIIGAVPVIADAKRGDIGNTSKAYARAIFDRLGFDAVTVSPYMGFDSLQPFIEYQNKGIFVLCRTSNAGAKDFQSLICQYESENLPLFEVVAKKANEWNTRGNIGLVVGATYPEELRLLRQAHPDITFLIPGIGAQGGDLETTIRYGVNKKSAGVIINSSRQIIFASRSSDFAGAARKAALALRDAINQVRENLPE
ncbi:MAG: orotidine-5'-phosphate decarboxylase [Dehalococcoidia bacterium]|nr:MAG: orotidine-5'-phosphate decarboxylase [Dehalococcoidia bacterium]